MALSGTRSTRNKFVWATGVTLLLATLVVVFRKPAITHALTMATVAGTLVVADGAVRVGHAGGVLVYVHNAGAAYVSTAQSIEPEEGTPRSLEVRRRADEKEDR